MKKYLQFFVLLFPILAIVESCSTSTQLYLSNNNRRKYIGQLSDSTFTVLKQYLARTTNSKLKDTIIIKYDYNNETCWNLLDQSDDNHIMGFVTWNKERSKQVEETRQHVSFFRFREPGDSLNKIIKWDNSIRIDSSKQLFNLLFRQHCTCGNSILIMPDKRYVFVRSDSHTDVLDLTQEKINQVTNKK